MPDEAVMRNINEVLWDEFPNHFGGALSKLLISPENSAAKYLDYRISTYARKAYVAVHKHRVQEQIYTSSTEKGLWRLMESGRSCASTM
jgi:hypothetical protein